MVTVCACNGRIILRMRLDLRLKARMSLPAPGHTWRRRRPTQPPGQRPGTYVLALLISRIMSGPAYSDSAPGIQMTLPEGGLNIGERGEATRSPRKASKM